MGRRSKKKRPAPSKCVYISTSCDDANKCSRRFVWSNRHCVLAAAWHTLKLKFHNKNPHIFNYFFLFLPRCRFGWQSQRSTRERTQRFFYRCTHTHTLYGQMRDENLFVWISDAATFNSLFMNCMLSARVSDDAGSRQSAHCVKMLKSGGSSHRRRCCCRRSHSILSPVFDNFNNDE